jgi:hypothetical protein
MQEEVRVSMAETRSLTCGTGYLTRGVLRQECGIG